jgi:hypothetical protein
VAVSTGDNAGNLGGIEFAVTYAPQVFPPTIAYPTEGLKTRAKRPLIEGTAQAGMGVKIFCDTVLTAQGFADGAGEFSLEPTADLSEGAHSLYGVCVSEDEFESSPSAVTAFVTDYTPPEPPTGLCGIAGDGYLQFFWDANTEADIAGYNIRRSASADGPFAVLNENLLPASPNPTYTDQNLTNNETYFYVITAVDDVGNESGYSTPGSGTPPTSMWPPAPPLIVLEKVQGDAREGLVGRCLWKSGTRDKEILRVLAKDARRNDAPVPGVPLSFEITSGGGFFVEAEGFSTVTDENGEAAVHYHLGMEPGTNQVTVGVLGDASVDPVQYSLEGHLPCVTLEGVLSPGTTDLVKSAYGDIFRVTVRDWLGQILAGEQVRMTIVGKTSEDSKGWVLPESGAMTDSDGVARFGLAWTETGDHTLTITLDDFPEFVYEGNVVENIEIPRSVVGEWNVVAMGGNAGASPSVFTPDYNGNAQIGLPDVQLGRPLKVNISSVMRVADEYLKTLPYIWNRLVGYRASVGGWEELFPKEVYSALDREVLYTPTEKGPQTSKLEIWLIFTDIEPHPLWEESFVYGPPEVDIVGRDAGSNEVRGIIPIPPVEEVFQRADTDAMTFNVELRTAGTLQQTEILYQSEAQGLCRSALPLDDLAPPIAREIRLSRASDSPRFAVYRSDRLVALMDGKVTLPTGTTPTPSPTPTPEPCEIGDPCPVAEPVPYNSARTGLCLKLSCTDGGVGVSNRIMAGACIICPSLAVPPPTAQMWVNGRIDTTRPQNRLVMSESSLLQTGAICRLSTCEPVDGEVSFDPAQWVKPPEIVWRWESSMTVPEVGPDEPSRDFSVEERTCIGPNLLGSQKLPFRRVPQPERRVVKMVFHISSRIRSEDCPDRYLMTAVIRASELLSQAGLRGPLLCDFDRVDYNLFDARDGSTGDAAKQLAAAPDPQRNLHVFILPAVITTTGRSVGGLEWQTQIGDENDPNKRVVNMIFINFTTAQAEANRRTLPPRTWATYFSLGNTLAHELAHVIGGLDDQYPVPENFPSIDEWEEVRQFLMDQGCHKLLMWSMGRVGFILSRGDVGGIRTGIWEQDRWRLRGLRSYVEEIRK